MPSCFRPSAVESGPWGSHFLARRRGRCATAVSHPALETGSTPELGILSSRFVGPVSSRRGRRDTAAFARTRRQKSGRAPKSEAGADLALPPMTLVRRGGPGLRWAVLLVLGASSPVFADEVFVDADSTFVAYEIRSPGTTAFLSRRRFVQRIGTRYSRTLGAAEPTDRAPIRLTSSVRLRLDQDFGDDCLIADELCYRATDASDPSIFQPLAQGTRLDAPEAWLEVRGLPGRTRIRAGRQMRLSPVGFLRFDGASAEVRPLGWLAADAYGGALVRRTTFLGSGAFEPVGAIRRDRDDLFDGSAPYIADPVTTFVFGGGVEVGATRIVRGRLQFREIREDAGLVFRRGAFALASQPIEELRLEGSTVFDLVDGALVDAQALVEVAVTDEVTAGVELERHLPRFDPGTIWAYFDLVPIHEGRLRASWKIDPRLEVGGALLGRVADFGAEESRMELDAGGEAWVRTRLLGIDTSLDAFVWGGALGPMAGVLLSGSRVLTSWLSLQGRASVWHFVDPLRQGLYGTSFSEALGFALRLSESTRVRGDVQHAYSRVTGHRFRGLVALSLEVWR